MLIIYYAYKERRGGVQVYQIAICMKNKGHVLDSKGKKQRSNTYQGAEVTKTNHLANRHVEGTMRTMLLAAVNK